MGAAGCCAGAPHGHVGLVAVSERKSYKTRPWVKARASLCPILAVATSRCPRITDSPGTAKITYADLTADG